MSTRFGPAYKKNSMKDGLPHQKVDDRRRILWCDADHTGFHLRWRPEVVLPDLKNANLGRAKSPHAMQNDWQEYVRMMLGLAGG